MQVRTKAGIWLVAIFAIAAHSAMAVPAIQLSESEFNFGKFFQNSKVSHTFWIKSTGSDTLNILQVVPGCGCTQMPLKDSSLAPGDSTSLEIVFSSRMMRGNVTKTPHIKTNAGDEITYIKFYSDVIPEGDQDSALGVSPIRLDISQFGESPIRKKASFTLENRQKMDVDLNIISYPKDLIKVNLPKKIAAGATATVDVEVNDSALKDEFEKCITFEVTTPDGRARYTLPVRRMYRANNESAKTDEVQTMDNH